MQEQTKKISQIDDNASTLAQNYTVVYQNTEGAARGLDGPGLVKMPDNLFIAVIPVKMPQRWVCEILHSRNEGETWHHAGRLPYYSAVPWVHDGDLFLFGHTEGVEMRNDDLHLLRSRDAGKNWSEPVTIARGHFWNCQTGMVRHGGKLYWAVDDLSPGKSLRGPRVIACDLQQDPMQPDAWRLSNCVPFPGLPDALLNPWITGDYPKARMLEPNVIETGGRLRVLMAVKPPLQATTGLGAVFDLNEKGGELNLSFTQYHPIPGGHLKFCVIKDEQTGLFWLAGNLAVDGQNQFRFSDPGERKRDGRPYHQSGAGCGGNDRRFLMLYYGLDGLNWFPAGCVARAGRMSQSFNYPALMIHNEDMMIIARSSINAHSRHDADYATFHRVRNFRRLAMNLQQDI